MCPATASGAVPGGSASKELGLCIITNRGAASGTWARATFGLSCLGKCGPIPTRYKVSFVLVPAGFPLLRSHSPENVLLAKFDYSFSLFLTA